MLKKLIAWLRSKGLWTDYKSKHFEIKQVSSWQRFDDEVIRTSPRLLLMPKTAGATHFMVVNLFTEYLHVVFSPVTVNGKNTFAFRYYDVPENYPYLKNEVLPRLDQAIAELEMENITWEDLKKS